MTEHSFSGFPQEAVDFLVDLKANNNRDWFSGHKAVYDRAIKRPAQEFCAVMADRLEALTGLQYRSKIFRVHRDLRFSKDKTPYNAHLHISFLPETTPAVPPGWIFGLEPDRMVIGACAFVFDKPVLEAYRRRVAGPDGETLASLLGELDAEGVRFNEPELKRPPRGFTGDPVREALLRRKGLAAFIDFPDPKMATEAGMVAICLDGYGTLKPLFDWLAGLKA